MQKYKISLVKTYENKGEDYDDQLSKHHTFRTMKFFSVNRGFSRASEDRQKRIIKKQLNMLKKYDLSFDVNQAEVQGKERIMVFEKGNYAMDEAVYDSRTQIPKHLRESKTGQVKKQDG